MESYETGTNLIESVPLKEYFDKLKIVTESEDLLSWERLKTIVQFNLGAYDHLIEAHIQLQKEDLN